MKFTRLRCVGFKSFVEPTEFLIEDGLTGVVGPNGCGKSNLVEALRWAMGENSYKNMRASGMDDVIFSGSANRPSRNTAEVSLFLDNGDRTAPAAFNDNDELQVSRRIEREAGSSYRINGREVRAKDVQLLFADASTGARSPSMVGQGRVGELIAAKPQARRALLEEAAGISGLHSRRHEAELRLRAADQNLERLEDVLAQLDAQIDQLKRQARQANRYRTISADIRKAEALLLHLKWDEARSALAEAEGRMNKLSADLAAKTEAQVRAVREQTEMASGLPRLREAEAGAAAMVQRLSVARAQLDEEERRLSERRAELEKRLGQLDEDLEREARLSADNAGTIERLESEKAELEREIGQHEGRQTQLKAAVDKAENLVAAAEQQFADLTDRTARENALAMELERAIAEANARHEQLTARRGELEKELRALPDQSESELNLRREQEYVDLLAKRSSDTETDILQAEKAVELARENERQARQALSEAESARHRIEAEIETLARLVGAGNEEQFPAVLDSIDVKAGFETALGAAFGEALDAPLEQGAAAFWRLLRSHPGEAPLPPGATPLAQFVDAPPHLQRALVHAGLVDKDQGDALQHQLAPGQILVTREGDVWRWDGFTASADAPTAAAQKLAGRNRLAELRGLAVDIIAGHEKATADYHAAQNNTVALFEAEKATRERRRAIAKDLSQARDTLIASERASAQLANKRSALQDAIARIGSELAELELAIAELAERSGSKEALQNLESELAQARSELAGYRAGLAECRASYQGFVNEVQGRQQRLDAISRDIDMWRERAAGADEQLRRLTARREETAGEIEKMAGAPEELAGKRHDLLEQIGKAEAERRQRADALAGAENNLAQAERMARQADQQLAEAREARARAEERLLAARQRCREREETIVEVLECQPAQALAVAGLDADKALPESDQVERRLEKLKSERERLGAVNLRAEAEQLQLVQQREALGSEREDLIEAIKRLRQGIASLNREGRERLLEAFGEVNEHFRRLFTHLFGGGTAELQLVESDDPLEAGLEILARPPGKRPQTMTLLSGGEQALTALALIFAVFLTNPAPICVLDEVDAPLDDHNVERFCNLMDEMVASTNTRFLIITHNPITMARMNRLFGVTMAERGVSEIVSVTLDEAERLRDAV